MDLDRSPLNSKFLPYSQNPLQDLIPPQNCPKRIPTAGFTVNVLPVASGTPPVLVAYQLIVATGATDKVTHNISLQFG